MHCFHPWLRRFGFVFCVVAAALSAQRRSAKSDDAWRLDPYTKADPAAMAALGYVSFGPFALGDGHGTADVEHVLGSEVKIRWIETAHFRIGCALPKYKLPDDRDDRALLRAEVKALAKVLPRLKPARVRKEFDPWLRAHLVARRAEATYAKFCQQIGVTDADFPKAGEAPQPMGDGPFLGMRQKYVLLLLEKQSSVGTYLNTYVVRSSGEYAMRHYFHDHGNMLYVTCSEFGDGYLAKDVAMHCEMTFNVVHMLVDGYRGFRQLTPHWFSQGLAHCYLRAVSPKHNVIKEFKRYDARPEMLWNWAPRVRSRVQHEHFTAASELLRWRFDDEKTLVDGMMLWSRIDYLLSLGDEGIRAYLDHSADHGPAPGETVSVDRQQELETAALAAVWQMTPAEFDAAWCRWVLRTYPKK